jgi:hypothetical protein
MSPTESDLRAALRDGEGDGPDIDRLIAGGQARQAQSRKQLLTAAAIVLVVAGAGAGGAVLWGGSSPNSSAAGSAYNNADAGGSAALRGTAGSSNGHKAAGQVPAAAPNFAAVACPASQPHPLLAGGGSPGQFGADGPLFSRTVSAVVVCSYGSPEQAADKVAEPARLVLTGDRAAELASSLEQASTARTPRACPNVVISPRRALAMIGVDSDGRTVGIVTANLVVPACNVQVTNGTAVRYQWTPPSDLQTVLVTLAPGGAADLPVPNRTPSGKVYPSPIKT